MPHILQYQRIELVTFFFSSGTRISIVTTKLQQVANLFLKPFQVLCVNKILNAQFIMYFMIFFIVFLQLLTA